MTDTIERLRELLAKAYDWPPSNLDAFAEYAEEHLPALLADLTRLRALERRWEEAPVCIVGDECQLWGGPDSLDDYIGKSVRLVREE